MKERDGTKEEKNNKANELAAINRRKQKQAAQQQSSDKNSKQIFSGVANKYTFGPPKMSHVTGKETRGKNRLAPLDTDGVTSPEGH